jgi:Cu(I)/Ag(I) efflux system membrane fusion protein
VQVTTRSLPGEVFAGEIVFVEPKLNAQTRTVQVRVHLENRALRLKPDMWVAAEIEVALSHSGRGAVPAPKGDMVCPMHPWEAADGPAICPICEMDMVPVTGLPQQSPPTDPARLLSVPRGAVMQTGERALVYVESSPGLYRGVAVTVGPLAQDQGGREFYPILAGLRGGERVVTRGSFVIDSQMELAGKPSLFSARGLGGPQPGAPDGQEHDVDVQTAAPDPAVQTLCPVMGNEVDTEVYADVHGVRVYFCCPPCIDKFKAHPLKYVEKLPEGVASRLRRALPEGE